MAERPALPERRNPLLEEERSPSHEILVERRCLGQTELKVKPGQVGTSNATKAENLGVLDYAHLRVPLPKDLAGSGIFVKGANRKWPEAYFLMRRSSDGFVSATGMFKAAFPFAQVEEEQQEKDYIKSLEEASSEEVAGNVWIDPGKALDLAEEYGIQLWIAALLDPESITHGSNDPKKGIKSPPPYHGKGLSNGVGRTPEKTPSKGTTAGKRSTRGARSLRSESPGAKPTPTPRKKATPRKPRDTRKARGGTLSSLDEDAASMTGGEVNGESAATAAEMAAAAADADTVKIEVESTVLPVTAADDGDGTEQVEATTAKITLPANHADLPLESVDEALANAREAVREANKLSAGAAPSTRASRKGKRKAGEMADADDDKNEDVDEQASAARPAKRQRPVEVELRKERIKRRALTGVAASLAIGALIPTVFSYFA